MTDQGSSACTVDAVPIGKYAPWIRSVIPDLLRLTELPTNWDSYGGRAPSRDLVNAVLDVLDVSEVVELPNPRVAPISCGGIQLEWILEGIELEVAFLPDGCATALLTDNEGNVVEESAFEIREYVQLRRVLADFATDLRRKHAA